MKEELIAALKVLLADEYALYFKAHGHHWNVEGDDFHQYHALFSDIYESLDDAIDPLAEWVRIFDGYAPFKLSRFVELSSLPETEVSSDPMSMARDLYAIMEIVADGFKNAGTMATNMQEYALANFFADQQGNAQKWCWQLRASLKDVEQD